MNLFNRILVTLLLLAMIPIVTVVLIVPHEAIQIVGDWLDDLDERVDDSISTGRLLIGGVIAVLVDALLVFLVYLQVRRSSKKAVKVQKIEAGEAQIAVSSIVERLEYNVDRLNGILSVQPKISPERRGVAVTLDVEITSEVDMTSKIEEISAVVRQVVEDEMGLKLKGKPKLNLRAVTYPEPLPLSESDAVDFYTPDEDEVEPWASEVAEAGPDAAGPDAALEETE
jgi:DNA-directed RNA polymerase subunit F